MSEEKVLHTRMHKSTVMSIHILLTLLIISLCHTPIMAGQSPDSYSRTITRDTLWKVTAEPWEDRLSASSTGEVDSFILQTMNNYRIPGVAACAIKNNRVIWSGAYGYANFEQGIEVADSTVFMLARSPRPLPVELSCSCGKAVLLN
jgi:CubicO group peptidase (beta-lactamase class C family)